MTYLLTVCLSFSTFWGLCGQIRQQEHPTLAACNAEREVLNRYKDVAWVTCEPKTKGQK
jgi:hypothetical protein